MTIRKRYSKEFKLDAVSLITGQGYTRSEAARSLDINTNMLTRWAKEFQGDDGQAFRGNGKLTPEQEEVRMLKIQVKRLQMEKDILKNRPRVSTPHRIETQAPLYCCGVRTMAVRFLVILSRQKTWSRGSCGAVIGGTYVTPFRKLIIPSPRPTLHSFHSETTLWLRKNDNQRVCR